MKYCSNCGKQLEDQTAFCDGCGTQQGATQVNVNVINNTPKVSNWDGGVFETFLNGLAASLIITLTCGIATPWAVCYMMKFIVSHAIVDGKRLSFTGTGGSLFGQWIKWFFLTLITCGIYSFWVTPRMYKWVVGNIHTEN